VSPIVSIATAVACTTAAAATRKKAPSARARPRSSPSQPSRALDFSAHHAAAAD